MACKNESDRKCFTLIWKIENANYYWPKIEEHISSPYFLLNEIDRTKWHLMMYLRFGDQGNTTVLLLKKRRAKEIEKITGFDWELTLLALDGTVMLSCVNNNCLSGKPFLHAKREDIFGTKTSKLLAPDTLTARLRIWKKTGEMLENVHFVARTIIGIEKRSFLWKVRDFTSLKPMNVSSYGIKSWKTGVPLLNLNFFLNDASKSGKICFAVEPKSGTIKYCTFQLSVVQASGNTVEFLKDEFQFDALSERKEFTQFLESSMLMEMKSEYLPNDVLTLQCMCIYNSGVISVIEELNTDGTTFEKSEGVGNHCADKEDVSLKTREIVLKDKMKSFLKDNYTDIKLKTNSKTYLAHKCILSMWSPVFKAMFSNDMSEKSKDCVDIEDMNDNTVFRLLQYFYSAELEELEWDDAMDLYEAADKYQIISLKDICSSFLKTHLCRSNVCAALLLADLHYDNDLKSFIQDYILGHEKDILNSEQWGDLMKTNLKLAAETMYLKFKE